MNPTRLKIEIVAEDDAAARRMVASLLEMLTESKPLNRAGYYLSEQNAWCKCDVETIAPMNDKCRTTCGR